jgi:hypothetical protein
MARSAVLLVMMLGTTVITATTVVIHASTVTTRDGRRRNGPSPARARMAPAIEIDRRHETAATVRPDAGSEPLVPPPCVYSPHGAPKTSATWKAATNKNPAAASHAATRGARLPESEEWVVAIATTYDHNNSVMMVSGL